jgi:hypothetical protein
MQQGIRKDCKDDPRRRSAGHDTVTPELGRERIEARRLSARIVRTGHFTQRESALIYLLLYADNDGVSLARTRRGHVRVAAGKRISKAKRP